MEESVIGKQYKLLVIGGSAGSLKVLMEFLPGIRTDTSLAFIIVLHRKTTTDNLLADLIASKTHLAVKEADEKEPIMPGTIYIAPPDYHLLIEKDHTISLDMSEKVNYSRPSIDVTFESAAYVYGDALICLLLSGANADGAMGMKTARQLGALTAIQSPESAEVATMPSTARDFLAAKKILAPADIASFINGVSSFKIKY